MSITNISLTFYIRICNILVFLLWLCRLHHSLTKQYVISLCILHMVRTVQYRGRNPMCHDDTSGKQRKHSQWCTTGDLGISAHLEASCPEKANRWMVKFCLKSGCSQLEKQLAGGTKNIYIYIQYICIKFVHDKLYKI